MPGFLKINFLSSSVAVHFKPNDSVMPEPGGGALGPPIFGRSVNPIPTGEDRLSILITTGTLNVFHLPASLQY